MTQTTSTSMEEKHRNGIIKVLYRPEMENGKLSRIGWFKEGKNGESIIYPTKQNEDKIYPLYLEIRSHRTFKYFIGEEIELQGYLTINRINGEIRSGHITPVNLPLMGLLVEKIIFMEGKLSML